MGVPHEMAGDPTLSAAADTDRVVDAFEAAWQAGEHPRIEDYLRGDGHAADELLVDLAEADLRWQLRSGETARVEHYLERYPRLADSATAQLLLIEVEFAQRRRSEPQLEPDEFYRRFPQLEAELRATIPKYVSLAQTRSFAGDSTGEPDETAHSPRHAGRNPGAPPDIPNYKILGELGRGGMGVIYKALDVRLQRIVALKMILSGAHQGADERARFLTEVQAIASLRHAGIVQVFDFGTHAGLPYFSLEFCEAGSLASRLDGTPLPPREAARLCEQLARAIGHAHDRGIVHRDLKPANILLAHGEAPATALDSDGALATGADRIKSLVLKISDFGLAKRVEVDSGMTATGTVLGTPCYMAPEQARGNHVGPEADIYALGAILYECLAGRPPFRAAKVYETLRQAIHEEPVAPRTLNRQVPRDLETICLKCLNKTPSRRYARAVDLADDLARFQQGQPIEARRVGALRRVALWCGRNPWLATTIAASLLTIALVTSVAFVQIVRERDRYRNERDRAEANLYDSLISDARAQMQGRDTGWWWQAMDDLHRVAALHTERRDAAGLRDLAIQCMGSEFPCLRVHATWYCHAGAVRSVAFSPDGQFAASGGDDGAVRVWSLDDDKNVVVLPGKGRITGVAWHPGGRFLAATSTDGQLRVWDLGSSAIRISTIDRPSWSLRFEGGPPTYLSFSNHGDWLAVGCVDGRIHLLSAAANVLSANQGPATGTADHRILTGHEGAIECLVFLGDEKRLMSSAAADRAIRFWDLAAGQQIETVPTNRIATAWRCLVTDTSFTPSPKRTAL